MEENKEDEVDLGIEFSPNLGWELGFAEEDLGGGSELKRDGFGGGKEDEIPPPCLDEVLELSSSSSDEA